MIIWQLLKMMNSHQAIKTNKRLRKNCGSWRKLWNLLRNKKCYLWIESLKINYLRQQFHSIWKTSLQSPSRVTFQRTKLLTGWSTRWTILLCSLLKLLKGRSSQVSQKLADSNIIKEGFQGKASDAEVSKTSRTLSKMMGLYLMQLMGTTLKNQMWTTLYSI